LRNPWAKKEWLGEWSDNSKVWTADLKKEVRFTGGDDGYFYMDFCGNFVDSN